MAVTKIKSNVVLKFLQENNLIVKELNFINVINVTLHPTLHSENIEILTYDIYTGLLSLFCFVRLDFTEQYHIKGKA